MDRDTVTIILSIVAILLSSYAIIGTRDNASIIKTSIGSIADVQKTQATMQSNWTKTSAQLLNADTAASQMLDELYLNQELMAEFLGIEVDESNEDGNTNTHIEGLTLPESVR